MTAGEDPTSGVVGLRGEQVICFEDIVIGECMTSSAIVVDRDELVDFAERWDPLPIHVNGEVAASRADRPHRACSSLLSSSVSFTNSPNML